MHSCHSLELLAAGVVVEVVEVVEVEVEVEVVVVVETEVDAECLWELRV